MILITNSVSLQEIAGVVTLIPDSPEEVTVKISSNCTNSQIPGQCTNVHVGDILHFTATIEPRKCLPNGSTTIRIYPKGLNQTLTVELNVSCECTCSVKNSTGYEQNSRECKGKGDLKCGVCECSSGRFGKQCQCDSTLSQTEGTSNCVMNGSTEICSGKMNKRQLNFTKFFEM